MRLLKTSSCLLAACVIAAGWPLAARAESATGRIEVSAFVVSNCHLTVAPLVFGEYDPLGTHQATFLDASTELRLVCSRDSRATLSLDGGRNATGPDARRLSNAGEFLVYQIFQDPTRTQPWGEGLNARTLSEFSGSREPERITIYGRIPAGQQVLSGAYSDSVTAKVDF